MVASAAGRKKIFGGMLFPFGEVFVRVVSGEVARLMSFCVVGVTALLIAGCGSWGGTVHPVENEEQVEDLRDDIKKEMKEFEESKRDLAVRDKPVEIPRDALWLGHSRSVHFKKALPALTLIETLAKPHPVKFEVFGGKNPMVMPPAKAVILKDYLDSIALQANWSWRVEQGVLIFGDWETKTIPLAALVGTLSGSIGVGGSAGGGAANSQSISIDAYSEIEQLVSGFVGKEYIPEIDGGEVASKSEDAEGQGQSQFDVPSLGGGQGGAAFGLQGQQGQVGTGLSLDVAPTDPRTEFFTISKSSNMLYLSARPNTVRVVDNVLETYNRSVSRRVAYQLQVLVVRFTDGDQRDLSMLELVKKGTTLSLNNGVFNFGHVNVPSLVLPAALTLGAGAVPGEGGSAGATQADVDARNAEISAARTEYNNTAPPSYWQATEAVFEWAENHGTLSNEWSRTFETLNNQLVTFANERDQDYVESSTTTLTEGGSNQTTVEVNKLTTGRTINLFSTIIGRDRVNIKLSLVESDVVGETPRGDRTLFTVAREERVIPISLHDKETRILSFSDLNRTSTSHGKNKILPVLGDTERDNKIVEQTILIITADIIDE